MYAYIDMVDDRVGVYTDDDDELESFDYTYAVPGTSLDVDRKQYKIDYAKAWVEAAGYDAEYWEDFGSYQQSVVHVHDDHIYSEFDCD